MEQEIKFLKDREIDQKNKASGYETLLRDGIPLNEHFLALKNKFNNDQKELEKQEASRNEELRKEMRENEEKKNRIRIMKSEFERLEAEYKKEKEAKERELKMFESKWYCETHTRKILEEERKKVISEMNDLKGQNAVSDRTIRQSRTFTSKRDEAHKEMKDQADELQDKLQSLNVDILKRKWRLDSEQRAFKNPMLLRRHNDLLMCAR